MVYVGHYDPNNRMAPLDQSSLCPKVYSHALADGGAESLSAGQKNNGGRSAEKEQVRRAVFALLHEPPSAFGINRTN
jgi:hypothetical protein